MRIPTWNSKSLFRAKSFSLGLEVILMDTGSFALLDVNVLDFSLDIAYINILGVQVLWLCVNLFIAW